MIISYFHTIIEEPFLYIVILCLIILNYAGILLAKKLKTKMARFQWVINTPREKIRQAKKLLLNKTRLLFKISKKKFMEAEKLPNKIELFIADWVEARAEKVKDYSIGNTNREVVLMTFGIIFVLLFSILVA